MRNSSREINWLKRDKRHGSQVALQKDIVRLEKGEPLAYVIGWVDFLGCRIDLSHKPLIPRPETEWWTEKAIKEMKAESGRRKDEEEGNRKKEIENRKEEAGNRKQELENKNEKIENRPKHNAMTGHSRQIRVLDVFAGSGCVGLAVLKHVPEARVDFADMDKKALAQIRKNLKLNRIGRRRAEVIHSNVLKNIRTSYDYILANPPYVSERRKRKVESSVRRFEPAAALWGGRDGLCIIRRFLAQAKKHLAPGGRIYMEFDTNQKSEITTLAHKNGYRAAVHKDQFGKWRYVIMSLSADGRSAC